MTISAHRTRIFWSPLVGWALLSCGVSAAHAQSTTPSDSSDPSAVAPTVPPGGAAPIIVVPGSPDDSFRRDEQRRRGGTLPDLTLSAPPVPSAATTIVNSPVGSSVPYVGYGGLGGGALTVTGNMSGSSASPSTGGITLGAFTLVPQLELNVGVDSNVFAQNASFGPAPTLYSTVTPTLDLRSEWLNHSLHVLASGTLGWYASAPTQNFQNYGISVDGRIDIRTDWYVTGLVGFVRSTEPLGSPNSTDALAPTVVYAFPVQVGMFQQFNRFFYDLTARATRYSYQDNSVIPETGLPAASRDRTEYVESIKLGYQMFEDLAVFVQPNFSQIRYVETINVDGQQRDSTGMNFSLGATWQVNAISVLEGKVGYETTNYESGGLSPTSAFSYSLIGTYTGYAPLTIRPLISRTINQAALSQYSNYISTTAAIDITYLIHDAWTLTGGLLFQTADYTPIPGTGATPRTDYFFRGQIGLLYSIRPEIQIGPVFEYAKGSSTNSLGPSYDRQVFSIRMIAKR